MPGYEIDRFVDLTQNEKNELICSICQDILRCPVVVNCCLQSFCDDCINDWLKTNSTCPHDRMSLTTDQLSRAPRVVLNLLGKLRIRCDFSDNGCKEVMVLENLGNHLHQCQYKYDNKECEKCFCDNSNANHDCVEYLLDTNNKITVELNQLKISYAELSATHKSISTELIQLKKSYEDMAEKMATSSGDESNSNQSNVYLLQQIEELKIEKENFLQTIAELSNESQSKPSTSSLASNKISDFNRDKKVDFKSVDMSSEMRDHAVNTALQASHKFKLENEIAAHIKKEFDRKYGSTWHCIVGKDFSFCVTNILDHYIYIGLKTDSLSVLLFKH